MPPEEISEDFYKEIKTNKENFPEELVGYVGLALSYGAIWFSSYRKDSIGKRNYSGESFRAMVKQAPLVNGITFTRKCVFDIDYIPYRSIIYCDPPYRDTAKYCDDIDHDKFYEWCRDKHVEGHHVYVSEYDMPNDFTCIWEKEVNSSLTKDTGGKKATEKLFTLV